MYSKDLLELFENRQYLSVTDIMQQGRLSERTARLALQELRQESGRGGFVLKTHRNIGYSLEVVDAECFAAFVQRLADSQPCVAALSKESRLELMLYFLLQQNGYTTMQGMSEMLDTSRSTVIADLGDLKVLLDGYNLQLDSKAHYGIRISGDETGFRRAFRRYVVESPDYTSVTQQCTDFCRTLDLSEIETLLMQLLDESNLEISRQSTDAILEHIRVLIYRMQQQNFVTEVCIEPAFLQEDYTVIARAVLERIACLYQLAIPETEQCYLAGQIAAKTSVDRVSEAQRKVLMGKIETVLAEVDEVFSTDFLQDTRLCEALLLHIYPLQLRIAFGLELANPLIDMVNTCYANVFLVALCFAERWGHASLQQISQDEVAFLALHFAAHFERNRQAQLGNIRRLLVVSDLGRGQAGLLQTELEAEFPRALVTQVPPRRLTEHNLREADLILSTLPELPWSSSYSIVPLDFPLDKRGLAKLKERLSQLPISRIRAGSTPIGELFSPELFAVYDTPCRYSDALAAMAQRMEQRQLAKEGFATSVLEREKRFSTIYQHGVAGPHGMEPLALQNTIGILLFKKGTLPPERVTIALLINTRRGYLFLHREISNLLLNLMEREDCLQKLRRAEQFHEVMAILQDLF